MANNEDLARLRIDKRDPAGFTRRRRPVGRWLAATVLVAILAAAAWRWVLNPVPTVRAATVTQVFPSQALAVLNASGYVVAQRKAAVASKGTGRLLWLGVEEGSRVHKGQTIARLESDDLRAVEQQAAANRDGSRAQREAAVANRDVARANRETATANLEQARAERDHAALSLSRLERLLRAGVAPRADYDAAVTQERRAMAAVSAAEHGVRAAENSVRAAEEAIRAAEQTIQAAEAGARGASINVSYTEIEAPFDGVVLTKNADVGDMVTPISSAANARAAVVTMADLGSLQVEADVSESNLRKVRIGQPCEVQLDALPDERFAGVVHAIVPTADRAKGTVLAKVRFLRLDPRMLPEMSAKVAFLSRPVAEGEERPRVAVSPGALLTRGSGHAVFVLKADRVTEVPVTAGMKLGDLLEVRAGLQGGERVVLNPPAKLRSGGRVKLQEG